MLYKIPNDLTLSPLSSENSTTAKALCDRFVGAGLYSEEQLNAAITELDHFFTLVYSGDTAVGYFYCYITDTQGALDELSAPQVAEVCNGKNRIGICRSIGIAPEYRSSGLAEALLSHFSQLLFEKGSELILIPAWKKGSFIPAQRLIDRCGGRYLCDLDKPWQKLTTLKCSYCNTERCSCDAVVYMMAGLPAAKGGCV